VLNGFSDERRKAGGSAQIHFLRDHVVLRQN
jgi:hypothetical protein